MVLFDMRTQLIRSGVVAGAKFACISGSVMLGLHMPTPAQNLSSALYMGIFQEGNQ